MLTSKPFLTAAIVLGAGLLAAAHSPVRDRQHTSTSTSTSPPAFAELKRAETIVFKGCAVTFKYVLATGAVESALNDPSESAPHANCSDVIVSDLGQLSLTLDDQDLGSLKFGEGYVSSGSDSCTTRIIGGNLYTWGSPCPN